MKRLVLWQVIFFLVTATVFSAERPRLVHADSLVNRQLGNKIIQDLWGNVELVQDSAYLYCQHAKWWHDDDRLILETDVAIHDGKRILKGDYVTYDGNRRIETARGHVSLQNEDRLLTSHELTFWQETEIAEALGQVVLLSEKDSVRIECGSLTYKQQTDYGLLLDNPVLIKLDTTETKNITIQSDTMQVWGKTQNILVTGNVRIKRGDMSATCQQAEYWVDKEQLVLTLLPKVYFDEQQMSGDSIHVQLKGTEFQGVQLKGKAEILSTDSTNTDRLQGRQIFLKSIQDSVRTVIIEGQAISEYNITEETGDAGSQTGFNKVTGDRIILTFIDKSIKRVRVESDPGLCTGEFEPKED